MKIKLPSFKKKSTPLYLDYLSGASVFYMPMLSGRTKTTREMIIAGYFENATVYACVKLISQSVAQLEPYLIRIRGQNEEELYRHEVLDLLNRPESNIASRSKFFEQLTAYLLLSGECFIWKGRNGRSAPKVLSFIPPHLIRAENDGKSITRFVYQGDKSSTTYPPEDIIYIRDFNPLNPFAGFSRLQAAFSFIDAENKAIAWNAGLLENGARVSGVFTSKEPLTEPQINKLKMAFEDYQGYLRAGKVPVLPFGLDFKEMGINPKDMDWVEAIKMNTRKICSVFGVPAELLGDSEAKTYSNYQEARRSFWLETVIPLAKNIYDELNAQLVSEWKNESLRLVFDVDQIDAIQENRREKYSYLNDAWWLSLNEKRQAAGYDTIPGGEYLFVPSQLIPTISTDGKQIGQSTDEQTKQKQIIRVENKFYSPREKKLARWREKEQRDLLWNNFYYLVKTKEKAFQPVVERYIKRQGAEIIERIKKAGSVRLARSNARLLDIEDEAKRYYDATKEVYLWTADHGKRAGLKASKGDLYELEEKFDVGKFTPEQRNYLESLIIDSGTKISKTTLEDIMGILFIAENENWTIDQLARAIRDKTETFAPWRARMIARTEAAKTENWAELEGYKESEFVDLKGWLSARVPNSREEHIDAANQYEDNPIPLAEPFVVGGEALMFPGDPSGSPGNIINCLCSLFPAGKE